MENPDLWQVLEYATIAKNRGQTPFLGKIFGASLVSACAGRLHNNSWSQEVAEKWGLTPNLKNGVCPRIWEIAKKRGLTLMPLS
jgi:hypothetical protein